ncbi:NAD-dependent epimerase/dehydratase family protein [Flavobacterium sp. RSB2_4_14]|uniref:NAD-dependent epimerase/dehydratase family protein n=1 Tax=Flavobacterium sp. RSB2_4_14 TaxID=3447665 RepID=UPI003F2C108F
MILVTGGTGLVGAHLLLHLTEKGENVRATYRNLSTTEKTKSLFKLHQKEVLFQKIDWVKADILDIPSLEIAFENITTVYHCAAHISFDPKEEILLRKVNIEGTANIVNFCIDKKVKKLCYVSSIAALGDLTQNENIITEDTEWNPEIYHSDYAISKYGAEMEVWRGFQEGLGVVIVNPGIILGSTIWDTGSGVIFGKVKNGLSFYTKGQTGHVSVTDVVIAMTQLMESAISGERFTLVAEHFTYEKIIKIIARKTGSKPPKFYVKPWITAIAWRLDWFIATFLGTKRNLSKFAAQSIHTIDWYSNEKIKNTLNFEFQPIEKVVEDIVNLEKK